MEPSKQLSESDKRADSKEILQQMEKELHEKKNSFNYLEGFQKASSLERDDKRRQEISWENVAFVFAYYFEPYVNENRTFVDPTIAMFLDGLRKEGLKDEEAAVPYLRKRAKSTANPFYKAKFSLAIWLFHREPDFVRDAVAAYSECAMIQLRNKEYFDAECKFHSAFFLARMPGFEESAKILATYLLPLAKGLADENQYGYSLRVLSGASFLSKYLSTSENNAMKDWALTISKQVYSSNGKSLAKWDLAKGFVNVAAQLAGNDLEAKSRAISEMARLAEAAATEAYSEGKEGTFGLYWEAASAYERASLPIKQKEMLTKAAESMKFVKYNRMTIDVPVRSIELTGKTSEEVYEQIGAWSDIDPIKEVMEPIIDALKGKSKFADTLVHVVESGGYPVKIGGDPQDFLIEALMFWIPLQESRLVHAFRLLENDKRIDVVSMMEFLRKSKVIPENTLTIIEKGLSLYFEGRYLAASHVMMPQVEQALRSVLSSLEIPTSKKDMGGIKAKELGGLLTEDAKVLGEPFAKYLEVKLTNDRGLNERNNLMHGLMEVQQINQRLCVSEIYILIRVCTLFSKLEVRSKELIFTQTLLLPLMF